MRMLLNISFCLLFIVLPSCSKAQEQDRILDIQEVTSPGGIKAWLVEDHYLPIISMQFAFKGAGSAIDPPDKQGLARLVSNTMDEGAGEYDSATFQKMLTDNSITIRFNAGRDTYGGYLKILTKNKVLAFRLLKLAINEPRFDEEPVERMRASNIARVKSSLSDPEWKAARLQNDIAFAGHPYAMNSGGTLTTLTAITPDDLKNFAQTRLGRDNLRIGVMGDITPEELGNVLDNIFGALPEKAQIPEIPDYSVQNGGEIILYEQDIPQTIIEIAQPGIGRDHPEYYTGMVMNFILGSSGFGSRLTEEIREKRGLSYGIQSYFQDFDHLDILAVSTSTKNESVGEMMDLIKREWTKMRDEPVTDKELADAKSYLIGSFPLSLSSTDNIAGILLGLHLDDLPIDYLDKRADRINAVTKEDVQKIAQELLDSGKFTTVLVGKPAGITPTKTVDTLPNVE